MSATLYSRTLNIATLTATTSELGYPVGNLLTPQIRRPWRSVGTGTQTLDIDLGAVVVNPVIAVQGCNVAAFTVSHGSAAYTTVALGARSTAEDRHGTRRLSVPLSGSVRYIRLVTTGLPSDAAPYWWAGALYVFGDTTLLPDNPLLGSEANPLYPQTRVDLPNGQRIVFDRGAPRQQLNLRFRTPRTSDIDTLVRLARRGPCWLDMGVAANRELQWPVQYDSDTATRTFAQAAQDEAVIPLYEIA